MLKKTLESLELELREARARARRAIAVTAFRAGGRRRGPQLVMGAHHDHWRRYL